MIAHGGTRPAPGTINALFFTAARRFDKPDALQVKMDGRYQPISHRVLLERVRHTALGLRALGLAPGDRVAILSDNRPEWAIDDYGCLTGGFVSVGIYPTLPAEQIGYILRDSGATAIFVSDPGQRAKIAAIRKEVPALRAVITYEATAGEGIDLTHAALEERGRAGETPATIASYEKAALAARPDDLAIIVYTSGTTGEPKGVMLTQDNLHSNVAAAAEVLRFPGDDVCLSFLPLSHTFERTGGHFLAMAVGASIAYAESHTTVAANMLEVRPTIVFSVPRLYEKIFAGVLAKAAKSSPLQQWVFAWARAVGTRWATERLAGSEPGGLLGLQYSLADRLVFSKLRALTGGRLRVFVSGGAPLAPEINLFFYAAGMLILEGYGLTETSPVITVNTPTHFRIGTVGRPISGVDVRIADDGEILARGPNIMRGYYNKPQATAEAIDAEGWFHTGDIGELRDGYLAITDRKKELLVTAGGKKIAPQPIENMMKGSPLVSQAVLIGDKRKYAVALIVPEMEHLETWAKAEGLRWKDAAELISLPQVKAKMESEVLGSLHGLAKFEMPQKVGLLPEELSVERGEITPTLKLKRKVIGERYAPVIDALYKEGGGGGAE